MKAADARIADQYPNAQMPAAAGRAHQVRNVQTARSAPAGRQRNCTVEPPPRSGQLLPCLGWQEQPQPRPADERFETVLVARPRLAGAQGVAELRRHPQRRGRRVPPEALVEAGELGGLVRVEATLAPPCLQRLEPLLGVAQPPGGPVESRGGGAVRARAASTPREAAAPAASPARGQLRRRSGQAMRRQRRLPAQLR